MIPFVFFIVSHTDRPSVHGASPFYIYKGLHRALKL